MRAAIGGASGLVVGLVAGWGAGMLWNPPSYEQVLPLIMGGMVAGAVLGVVLARRRR